MSLSAVASAAAATALLLASSVSDASVARPGQTVQSIPMVAVPSSFLRVCRSSRLLAPACPRRLPATRHLSSEPPYQVFLCRRGGKGCLGLHWDDLEIQHAGNSNRPPVWLHVAIFAGNLSGAFPFSYPRSGRARQTRNGLFAVNRRRALFLGERTWGGISGALVLAPSYPAGGEQGDHLIFRWRRGSVGYAVGLHGWEPFLQTVATLEAIVASIPDS